MTQDSDLKYTCFQYSVLDQLVTLYVCIIPTVYSNGLLNKKVNLFDGISVSKYTMSSERPRTIVSHYFALDSMSTGNTFTPEDYFKRDYLIGFVLRHGYVYN